MKSRITIEVDFQNYEPYIKVVNDIESDDVRDKLITHFRQKIMSKFLVVRFHETNDHRSPERILEISTIPKEHYEAYGKMMLEYHNEWLATEALNNPTKKPD